MDNVNDWMLIEKNQWNEYIDRMCNKWIVKRHATCHQKAVGESGALEYDGVTTTSPQLKPGREDEKRTGNLPIYMMKEEEII